MAFVYVRGEQDEQYLGKGSIKWLECVVKWTSSIEYPPTLFVFPFLCLYDTIFLVSSFESGPTQDHRSDLQVYDTTYTYLANKKLIKVPIMFAALFIIE